MPPSVVAMLFTKEWTFSVNSAEYCMATSRPTPVVLAGDVDDVFMGRLAGAVEIFDELQDAPLVEKRLAVAGAMVAEDDASCRG